MSSLRTLLGFGLLGARILARSRRPGRAVPLERRLEQIPRDGLPLSAPVRIHWNAHHVPFVEAGDDRDAAVALGLVHAHLRLTQMEVMRRAAYGRLAELLGPVAVEIDHVLRVLDLPKAVPAVRARLPEETHLWLSGFRDGVNVFLEHARERPEELAVLGARAEPWSLDDLIAIGRVAAADFTWKVWLPLLRMRGRPDWMRLWERLAGPEAMALPNFTGAGAAAFPSSGLADLLGVANLFSRSGSNSVAVAASRSASGGALMANDPHLPIVLPNPFLIAGFRSPSYHALGLMIPGIPVVGLGRNPWIAWGGTSLHASSSDLFDVTDLPADAFAVREERIRVRWGRDVSVTVRDTEFGPVISDAPILGSPIDRTIALKWMGHAPSDETTALLRLARARNRHDFLAALDGFAVPALNMTYADAGGEVGICMAAHLPARPSGTAPSDILVHPRTGVHWRATRTARDLPHVFGPPRGFVASANNRPETLSDVLISHFFAPDTRVRRLSAIVSGAPLTAEALKASHRDVFMESALHLRDRLVALSAERAEAHETRLFELLKSWDGRYEAEAAAPVALELLIHHLMRELHGEEELALFTNAWEPWALVRRDLETLDAGRLLRALKPAIERTCRDLELYPAWGDMHRLRLQHAFAAAPVVGRRYRFLDVPTAGSNETLMKTAHGFSGERHFVRLGAIARHVSDLSDPDANDFVLLGGQDGWIGSSTFLDQFELWRAGRYIRVPLRLETVRAAFPHEIVLTPGRARSGPRSGA